MNQKPSASLAAAGREVNDGVRVVELVNIEEQVRTRLIRLDSATLLEDLRAIRGNRLDDMKDEEVSINGPPRAIRVPANHISLIVNEKRGITADTAAGLGRHFGTSAQYWLNLQNCFDLDSIDKPVIERDAIPKKAA